MAKNRRSFLRFIGLSPLGVVASDIKDESKTVEDSRLKQVEAELAAARKELANQPVIQQFTAYYPGNMNVATACSYVLDENGEFILPERYFKKEI